jgi:hypothetical protein
MKLFRYPKQTDTHADTLAVAGLGYLLQNLGGVRRKVQVRDTGANWELTVDPPFDEGAVGRWDGDPLYDYIQLPGDDEAPEGAFDYAAESARLEVKRKTPKKRRGRHNPAVDAESSMLSEAAAEPHPETALLRIFNGMRKGFKGDIKMHAALRTSPPREALGARLKALTGLPSEPFEVELPLSASQWFTPLCGKGVTRVKANGAGLGQFPVDRMDWFDTWMRYVGMYQALTSHGVGDDLKLAVLVPADIDAEVLPRLRARLRDRGIFGGRVDVRAPLELARTLVEHSEELVGHEPGWLVRFGGRRPREVLRGLQVTTYKKMGTASSVMNVAFLGIPSWSSISDRITAQGFLETLADLDAYQRALRVEDNISEDIELMRVLRDLVSAGTVETACSFFAAQAAGVLRRLSAQRYFPLISEVTVRRIFMGIEPSLSAILDDAGFKSIAKAIRAATIHAQLHENDRVLQPRYGLAQAWRQAATQKERFASELARFVQGFNADVVRKREVDQQAGRDKRLYPSLVMVDDLTSVLRLVEAHGSPLVAHLLLAVGFAQTQRAGSSESTSTAKESA